MPAKTTNEEVRYIVMMALRVIATRDHGGYRLADADVETFATMIAVDVFPLIYPDVDIRSAVYAALGISSS